MVIFVIQTRWSYPHIFSLCVLQELKNLIPKSAVGTLSANSSNVIKLIIDAYNVSQAASFVCDIKTCLPAYKLFVSLLPTYNVADVSLGQSLSSEVILENGRLPEGVSITYKSICKNNVVGTGENGRKCSNISIGDEVGKMFWAAACLHVSFCLVVLYGIQFQ